MHLGPILRFVIKVFFLNFDVTLDVKGSFCVFFSVTLKAPLFNFSFL